MAKDRDDSSNDLPEDDFSFLDDDIGDVDDIEQVDDVEEVDFGDVEEVEELSDSAVDLDDVEEVEALSDSAVELDDAVPTIGSEESSSDVEWDDMVEEDAAVVDDSGVSLDSRSGVDVLDLGDSGVIEDVDEVVEVDSSVDLGGEALEPEVIDDIEEVVEIDSGVDLDENVLEPEVIADSDSATDLSKLIESEVQDSTDDSLPAVDDLSDPDVLRENVEVDLDDVEEVEMFDDPLAEVEAGGSGVQFGEDSGQDSGRDLIAEALESGTDLGSESDSADDLFADEVEEVEVDETLPVEEVGEAEDSDSLPLDEVEAIDESDELVIDEVEAIDDDLVEEEVEVEFGADLEDYDSESSVDLGDPGDITLEELASGKVVPQDSSVAHADDDIFSDEVDEVDEVDALIGEDFDSDELSTADSGEVAVSMDDVVDDKPVSPSRKPSKPVKQKSRAGALVGGTVLGLLIGVGGSAAALMYGPDELKEPLGLAKADSTSKPISSPRVNGGPPLDTLADTGNYLAIGDLAAAERAGIETIDETKPELLALRGEYRFKKYLQTSVVNTGEISPDDETVKAAMQDLQKAGTPDAQFQLAQIHELSGNLVEAEKLYAEGQQKYPTERRFEAGLARVQAKKQEGGNAATSALPFPNAAFAYMVVTLQQPGGVQPPDGNQPPAAAADEAGFDFWQAVKLAKEMKFSEALLLLQKAREIHRKARFARLGKAQNPDSDPAEEIFLRSAKELETYWKLQGQLQKGGYLTANRTDPVQAMQDAFINSAQGQAAAKKLVDAQLIAKPDELASGVDNLLTQRTANLKTIDMLNTTLTTTKKSLDDANTMLTDTKKKLESEETKVATLEKSLLAASNVVTEMKKELVDTKYLDADAGPDKIVPSLQKALKVAAMKDPQGEIRSLTREVESLTSDHKKQLAMLDVQHKQDVMTLKTKHQQEIKGLNEALSTRWKPEQMMEIWRPALLENRDQDLATKALADVARVKADPNAGPKLKAEAQAIEGLALRNTNQYPAAKMLLEKTKPALSDDAEWNRILNEVLAEVSNPAQFHGERAQRLVKIGDTQQALESLTQLIAVVPVKEPLLAQRSLLLLEDAHKRHNGNIPFNDKALVQAQADAQTAEQANLAEGFYAAGRVAEVMGRRDIAIAKYREALRIHPAADEQGSLYRAALARLLTASTNEAPLPGGIGFMPLLMKFAGALAQADPNKPEEALEAFTEDELRLFLTLVSVPVQAPWAGLNPEREEAMKIADEILKSPDSTFEARAQAYAIKGDYTKALETMTQGLSKELPANQAELLRRLVDRHPALVRASRPTPPNPLEAEKHFADGLRNYFARDYKRAEEDFEAAVKFNDRDARYYYFLGLVSMIQSKPRTAEYLAKAAQLEQEGLPSQQAVNRALERVQGPMRKVISVARDRFRNQ